MQRRAQGALAAAKELLASGFNGQAAAGDAVSLWTFNEKIETNAFESWSAQGLTRLSARLATILGAATYEKRGQIDRALAGLAQIDARVVTAVLITSGEEEVHGTPIDERINRVCAQWRSEQQKARMPFLIVLRASHGRIIDGSVTPAPWPVEIPPLPPEPQIARQDLPKAGKSASASAPSAKAPATMAPTHAPEPLPPARPPAAVVSAPAPQPKPVVAAVPPAPNGEKKAVLPAGAAPVQTDKPVAKTPVPPGSEDKKALPAPVPAALPQPSLSVAPRAEEPAVKTSAAVLNRVSKPDSVPPATPIPPGPRPAPVPPMPAPAAAAQPPPLPLPPPSAPPIETRLRPDVLIASAQPPPSRQSFVHENAVWLAMSVASGITAIYLLLTWIRIFARPESPSISPLEALKQQALPATEIHALPETATQAPGPEPTHTGNAPSPDE